MVGSVGMVRGISRPSSLVIQEALNLLSALGSNGKGTTKKLLTEMKGVQDHNGAVLADAKEAVENANKREVEVVEKEEELARNLIEAGELYNSRLLDVTNGEEELQRRIEETNAQISEENEAISTREDELRRDREEHQESLRTGREEFTERERVLKEDREDLKQLESSIGGREEEVKSDRTTLDDLRDSLDKRRVKLDERDARMLVAMEDKTSVE